MRKPWKTESRSDSKRKNLAVVKIQRVIFQGDWVSPLLFVIARIPLNHVRSKVAQKGYENTHNGVGTEIHYKLCKSFNLTLRTNSICTTKNPSSKMSQTNFSCICDKNGSPNFCHLTRSSDCPKKLRAYREVNFAIPYDHCVKLKET